MQSVQVCGCTKTLRSQTLGKSIPKINEFMCGGLNGACDARPTNKSMLKITLLASWAAYPHLLRSLTHGACATWHLHTLANRLPTFSTAVYVGAIALRRLGGVGGPLEFATVPTAFAVRLLPPKIVAPASNNDAGHAQYIPSLSTSYTSSEIPATSLKKICGPCPCLWPPARAFGLPPLTHLAARASPHPAFCHTMNRAYRAASPSTIYASALPWRPNPHDFPITPPPGGEGGALALLRHNSRGVDLRAPLEPMVLRTPIQIFWRHIAEPAPVQTFIREWDVHVTTMVHQCLAFTREVALQSRRAGLLGWWVARLLINLRLLRRCKPTTS